jgi:hypothetical protein
MASVNALVFYLFDLVHLDDADLRERLLIRAQGTPDSDGPTRRRKGVFQQYP